jgi:hypothetical protein
MWFRICTVLFISTDTPWTTEQSGGPLVGVEKPCYLADAAFTCLKYKVRIECEENEDNLLQKVTSGM